MKKLRLKDLFSIKKGTKVEQVEVPSADCVRYIQIDDLRDNSNPKFCKPKENYVYANKNHIIIAWDGANAGTVSYGLEGAIGSTLAILETTEQDVYIPYVGRFLQYKNQYLRDTCTGATIPHISRKALENLVIPLPTKEEQKNISKLLDKTQELIDKRKAQIEALDQLAQSVFLDMFGDPLANPKGWPKVTLKDYICKVNKNNLKNSKNIIKYIDISSIDNNKNKITSYTEYIGFEAPSRAQQEVQKGDILISTVRPNLKNIAMVLDHFDNLICSTGFCVIRCTEKLNSNFIFHLVKTDSFTNNLVKKTTGANYPAIKNSDIYDESIIYPPLELQEKFSRIINQIDEKKTSLEKSLSNLEKLFNSLIQRAFKGELFTEEKVS